MAATSSKSAAIRAKLDHPIIDSDGHLIEVTPVLYDYIRAEGGESVLQRVKKNADFAHWTQLSADERSDARTTAITWWLAPTKNGLDRATAMIPRLLAERLDDLGLDFCALYPSGGLGYPRLPDEELRRVCCRAYNKYVADTYGPYSSRMTPAALIPLHNPEEGIEEMEFAVRELGLKVAMIAGHVRRPIGKVRREHPGAVAEYGSWYDVFGEDSEYDYDPFWAKSIELGMPLATHTGGFGFTNNSNINNFMQNHLGHFANAGNLLCKSLFFSGVTRRLPKLRMAFLECGAGWAADLYAGIIARWEKRNPEALQNVDPRHLDEDRIMELFAAYGDEKAVGKLEEIKESLRSPSMFATHHAPDELNDFALTKPEDIRDRFIPNFFFGCEADDPMNAAAFNPRSKVGAAQLRHRPLGRPRHARRRRSLRTGRVMTGDDFRDFTFTNPLRFFTDLHERCRVQYQDRSVRREGRRHAQLRHRPLGRPRHARRGRRSLRTGRARPHDRRRLPRLHLHQPPPLLLRLLRRHRHRGRGEGGPRPSLLQPLPRRAGAP